MKDEIEFTDPVQITDEMKEGLAQVYSNKGYRLYLENYIKIAMMNMVKYMNAENVDGAKRQANYIGILKTLLAKGREQYTNAIQKRKPEKVPVEKPS